MRNVRRPLLKVIGVIDTYPTAKPRTYDSLAEAGPLPDGAQRLLFKSMDWAWVSPGNLRLLDKPRTAWSLDEDDVPTVTVSVGTLSDLSPLVDGEDLGEWLDRRSRPSRQSTRPQEQLELI